MDSKERVSQALKHQDTDRVPIDFWSTRPVTDRLIQALGATSRDDLLTRLGVDFRYVEGSRYKRPELATFADGSSLDLWGVRRKTVHIDQKSPTRGSYEHVMDYPLAQAETVAAIETYAGWPSPDWYDYSQVAAACDRYPNHAIVCGGDRLNRTAQLKTAIYLRGIEQIMIDLALHEKMIEALFARISEYYLEYNRRIFEQARGKIDIFFMGDDFGTQHGLIMSLDMWRRFIRPGFKKFIELAHRHGIMTMHHSCGAIRELIPDFIDCGLDILQSLQPGAQGMDLAGIKREYGRDLCFQGGIDIQQTMPRGTPAEVEQEVRSRIRTLGAGGGYILCTAHNMQPDVPTENALSLFRAAGGLRDSTV